MSGASILPRRFNFSAADWGLHPLPGSDEAATWLNEMLTAALPTVGKDHDAGLFVSMLHQFLHHIDPKFGAAGDTPRDMLLTMASEITGAPRDVMLAYWKRCELERLALQFREALVDVYGSAHD